mgnify:CR=1 FL=1
MTKAEFDTIRVGDTIRYRFRHFPVGDVSASARSGHDVVATGRVVERGKHYVFAELPEEYHVMLDYGKYCRQFCAADDVIERIDDE